MPTETSLQAEEALIHVLWINAGLSCDGDSVALTAATQPSIEEIALGALPGLPEDRGALAADRLRVRARGRGRRLPRVVPQGRPRRAGAVRPGGRGLHPQRADQRARATGAASATTRPPASRSPPANGSTGWRPKPPRSRGRHLRHLRRHPRHGRQPDRRDGRPRLSGLGLEVQGRHSDRLRARAVPSSRTTSRRRIIYLLYQATGQAPMIPLDEALRPTWLFGATVHEGCDRAGYYEQGDFATEYGSPEVHRQARLLGPGREVQRAQAGLDQRRRRLPERRRHLHRLHDAGFPDKFMPFMDEPPGGKLSTNAVAALRRGDPGAARASRHTVDKEPKWRRPGRELTDRSHAHLVTHRLQPDEAKQMTSTIPTPSQRTPTAQPCRDGVGPHHPDRRQPRHLHQDRLRATARWSSATARPRSSAATRIFMKGKDPRDAHFITSRICGICGDNHATCSCYAQNMAYGVKPPHLGEWIVNLGEAAEYMFDHNIFQENLVGVDYCEKMVAETNPGVLAQGRDTPRPRTPPTTATARSRDIMRSLNPFTGEFYREALQVSRLDARDVLPDGRPPRPPVHAVPRRRRHGRDHPADDRLHHPADALRRVHEEGRADARRPLRLLLRGAAGLRAGRPAAHAARLLGLPSRIRSSATSSTRT